MQLLGPLRSPNSSSAASLVLCRSLPCGKGTKVPTSLTSPAQLRIVRCARGRDDFLPPSQEEHQAWSSNGMGRRGFFPWHSIA